MTPPPLCIVQARLHSTRLPQKMLQTLGGETLIARAWRIASEVFTEHHTVVAIPASGQELLIAELERIGACWMAWDGPEWDVLGRLHYVAHQHRWHPDSVLHRYTPDDHRKNPDAIRAVLRGERWPVETGGEAFTLAMLDHAYAWEDRPDRREHISYALYPSQKPLWPFGWTIDTHDDLVAARRLLGRDETDAILVPEWPK